MAIDGNKQSVTKNPAGSTKVQLRALSPSGGSFTRNTFMRDLKKVAKKIGR